MAAERKDVRVALTFDFDGVRRLDRTRRGKSCSAISRLLRLDRYARPYLGPSRSVWRHSGVAGNEKRALDGGNAVREMFSLKSIQMVQGSVCIVSRSCFGWSSCNFCPPRNEDTRRSPGANGTRKCDIRAVVQSVAPVPFPVLDNAFADDGHHDEFKSYYNPALAPASDSSPIKASNGAQERGDPSEPSQ
jgi:hypothetical protein